MNRDRRSSSNDPTSEPAADQSTRSASGLSAGRFGPGVERNTQLDRDDVVNRRAGNPTPRRYDQPVEEDDESRDSEKIRQEKERRGDFGLKKFSPLLPFSCLITLSPFLSVKAPSRIETERLVLRRPERRDAAAVFNRYASDPDVTRFLGWPMHRSIADTKAFLAFSDDEWHRWAAGPYLIELRADGSLIGGSGLGFETADCAVTGYVLAKDAWGRGYATETLRAIVDLAAQLQIKRLYALCHPDHRASRRVLEKNGFEREALLHAHTEFPNLNPGQRGDVLRYSVDPSSRSKDKR